MKIGLGYYFLILFIILSFASVTQAQSFGFGCLGLSGFYGGYSQQEYTADGINLFAQQNYSISSVDHDIKFQKGTGFRIGANVFRAKFSGVFLTLKGYFQFLKEEHEIVDILPEGVLKNKYQLSMNHWGLGVDFGFPLFSIIDLKLVEGGVTFYDTNFDYQTLLNDNQLTEQKFSPDKLQLGYYVGSGIIIHLIRDYISIEGTVAFSKVRIEKIESDDGSAISSTISQKRAIEKGGLIGTIQLNVGFPF